MANTINKEENDAVEEFSGLISLVKRMRTYENWRRGKTDKPMRDCVPSLEQLHKDQRRMFALVSGIAKLVPLAAKECVTACVEPKCFKNRFVHKFLELVSKDGKAPPKKMGVTKK